jgi:hypothetical protein
MVESTNDTHLATEEAKTTLAPEFCDFDERMRELEQAGLVQMREGLVRFNHQSIQEYCAAQHLWRLGDTKPESFREKIRLERWDESVHLLILFDESGTKSTRHRIFGLMLKERTFDLLADCFSNAESVQWEQVVDTLGVTVISPDQPLPFRREALLSLGRLNNRELDRTRIVSWVLGLFDQPVHEALWPDVLMVHVRLGEELRTLHHDKYMTLLFERKPYLERLLRADSGNPDLRTKTLEYLSTGKFGSYTARVIEEDLLRLLTDSRTSDSDVVLVAQALQTGEVEPNLRPPYDEDITQALLRPHKPAVQATLKWLGEKSPVSVPVLNNWVAKGWLDLFVEHKANCPDFSDLSVNADILEDLRLFRFKEPTHAKSGDQKELAHRLTYLECLGGRGDRWLPAVVELALLSAPSYQKLVRDFLIGIPAQPNTHASPVRAMLVARPLSRDRLGLLKQALEDNPPDVTTANVAAFLLGQIGANLDAAEKGLFVLDLRKRGDRLIESECADPAAWIRLLHVVSQFHIGEMADDLNRWGWAFLEWTSERFLTPLMPNREHQEIFAAFLMAFRNLFPEGTLDLAPYWLRVFFWAGRSFPFSLNNWTEVHFSQLSVGEGAKKLLLSGDPRDVLIVADIVATNSTFYDLRQVACDLLARLGKVTDWRHSCHSREVIERACHFKLAIGEDRESCSFVCDMIAKGDREYTTLLLQRFMSGWTNAEPPGIPDVLQEALLNNQEAKSVFKSKLEDLGNENGIRGLAYLNWVDSGNMSKVFSGCVSGDSHLRDACRSALSNWMESCIVGGCLPAYISSFLKDRALEGKGDPCPAWTVLTLMAELATRQVGSVRLFVRDQLSKKLDAIVGACERDENDVGEAFRRLLKSLVERDRAKTSEEIAVINAVGEGLGQFFGPEHSDLVKHRARQLQVFCTGLTGVRYSDHLL